MQELIRIWDTYNKVQDITTEEVSKRDIEVGTVFGKTVYLDKHSLYKCVNFDGELEHRYF